jgi:hypothetical protein
MSEFLLTSLKGDAKILTFHKTPEKGGQQINV